MTFAVHPAQLNPRAEPFVLTATTTILQHHRGKREKGETLVSKDHIRPRRGGRVGRRESGRLYPVCETNTKGLNGDLGRRLEIEKLTERKKALARKKWR